MSTEMLFFVLLLVVCALIGYLAIPRVMRKWSVATKPTDERLDYASHLARRSTRARWGRCPPSANAHPIATREARRFASYRLLLEVFRIDIGFRRVDACLQQ